MLSYLKFWLKSTNEHGVHSPFVFDYLTKCLYKKPHLTKNKTHNLVCKSINYFGHQNIKIVDHPALKKQLQEQLTKVNFKTESIDLAYYKTPKQAKETNILDSTRLHNNSMLVVDQIRKDPQQFAHWQQIMASSTITVSIDFFYCGVVFMRQEQPKQHFTIRL